MWITDTSLCIKHMVTPIVLRKLNSFYDKKDYPISYPFKSPPYGGFFVCRGNGVASRTLPWLPVRQFF